MAAETGLSQSVPRIWLAFRPKPPAVETWMLSSDSELSSKVRDFVGLETLTPTANASSTQNTRNNRTMATVAVDREILRIGDHGSNARSCYRG